MTNEAIARFRGKIGEASWERLRTRLQEVNRDIRTRGIRPYAAGHSGNFSFGMTDLLTGYAYEEFYDWDLYFENLYLAHFGISRYCRNNIEAFLDKQLASGFVARTLIHPRMRQHFKPFLAQTALLGIRQTGSGEWLRMKYYERLRKYVDYWFWYCDLDKNGLCVWDSADASGMDNQELRAGKLYAMEIEGADLNSYLVRELRAMAVLARGLGRDGEGADFDGRATALGERINRTLWCEEDGFYYDRNERTGERVRVKSIAGFLPLWAGIVPQDRAERLVREHLLNPEEFWLPYPIAAWARNEPGYYQERKGDECNWMGTCWIPTNYMVFHGLIRHGFREVAEDLAYRTFRMALSEADTREYYNAETGCGQGLNPFWGWSALAYLLPLEYELGLDPTRLRAEPLPAPIADGLGVAF